MDEPEIIIKHWNDGLTSTQIAQQLGVSRSAIAGKIYRLRASGINLERRAMIRLDIEKQYREKPQRVKKMRNETKQLSLDAFFVKPASEPELSPIIDVVLSSETPTGIDLFSLKSSQCHYVIGRHEYTAMYCGEAVHRRSMCRDHYRRCYVVVK